MILLSLKIHAIGNYGWESEELVFGKNITQIYGPNGCGKTPIVQSIAFCLGFPSIFRKDIYDHCGHVTLKVKTSTGIMIIKRTISRDVEISIQHESGTILSFYNEQDYSEFIFELLDLKSHTLVSNSNHATSAYLSSILPIFYLDQDDGYSKVYCPPNNFIRDQFAEMIRMVFDLPVKNSFDIKKDRIYAKDVLTQLDKQIEIHNRQLQIAKDNIATVTKSPDIIRSEIAILEKDFETIKSSNTVHDESIGALDRIIHIHRKSIKKIDHEIFETSKRVNGLAQLTHEINTEIDTLNLNEEARRVFLSFNEICSSSCCHLFNSSSNSYSKNLLYLKDQIKDLQRNSDNDRIRIELLDKQKNALEILIKNLVYERSITTAKSEISALVDTISEIKNQIFELQTQLSNIERVNKIESYHFELLANRNKALENYDSLSTERSLTPEIIRVRSELRTLFIKWVDVIKTQNISKDITFQTDFIPILGSESIQNLKGSTKIRTVLAFHAALLELMANLNKLHFRFLILDTPKQHEIHIEDLENYIQELKKLCVKSNIQIIFSTTEYHYSIVNDDKEWTPKFPGNTQNMFLSRPVV
jgi:chromosome segregation ATPase